MSETHVPPTPAQRQHVAEAVRNPQLAAKANGGHPPIAATARPASFNGPGVVGAKGAAPRTATPPTPARAPMNGAPRAQPNAPAASAHAPAPMVHAQAPKAPPAKAPPKPQAKPKPKPERREGEKP
jgi:hypothetical protein